MLARFRPPPGGHSLARAHPAAAGPRCATCRRRARANSQRPPQSAAPRPHICVKSIRNKAPATRSAHTRTALLCPKHKRCQGRCAFLAGIRLFVASGQRPSPPGDPSAALRPGGRRRSASTAPRLRGRAAASLRCVACAEGERQRCCLGRARCPRARRASQRRARRGDWLAVQLSSQSSSSSFSARAARRRRAANRRTLVERGPQASCARFCARSGRDAAASTDQ